MDDLGAYIQRYVDKEGITFSELARRMEVDKSTLSRTRRGISAVSLDFLRKLASVTGGDVATLIKLSLGHESASTIDTNAIAQQIIALSSDQRRLFEFILVMPDGERGLILDRMLHDLLADKQRNNQS